MSVASKNLFALLGNDEEEPVKAPVKTVDKTPMRTGKRGAEPEAPSKPANAGARRGPGGNEGAFRDRNAGAGANQGRSTDESTRGGGARGGRGARERGGPGGRFPRDRNDRHSKSQPTGGDKAAAQSLGAEGDAEAKDEQAGEELAQKEIKEAAVEDAEGTETPAEPETKSVSYEEYLAQQAEKKLALGDNLELRQANEGSKGDKKWSNAKALEPEEGEDFMPAAGGKTQRQRERKQKNVVDIDQAWIEPTERPASGAPRGGRGGARGDGAPRRGDGARGGRGRGEGRGRGGNAGGAPRGGNAGGAPRGGNAGGAPRGGRGGAGGFNANDQSAFPSLGKN